MSENNFDAKVKDLKDFLKEEASKKRVELLSKGIVSLGDGVKKKFLRS